MPQRLLPEEIDVHLKKFPDWEVDDRSLLRSFDFETYMDGIEFVNEVAEIAEEAGHHPDITVGWCHVELRATTHSKGGITELDFALAELLDRLES